MRRLVAIAGVAACTLLASCGPSKPTGEQWKGYRECVASKREKDSIRQVDRWDVNECARNYGIDPRLVDG